MRFDTEDGFTDECNMYKLINTVTGKDIPFVVMADDEEGIYVAYTSEKGDRMKAVYDRNIKLVPVQP